MSYVKANEVLPNSLLKEIQKYIEGETLYIPKKATSHQRWGVCSGLRQEIDQRNKQIIQRFNDGNSIDGLSEEYFLSIETIKKIVYTKNKSWR